MKSEVIANLPTLADRGRCAPPKPTKVDRLNARADAQRENARQHQAFRTAVIARDGHVCRCCGGKVVAAIQAVPNRLEVSHLHGRVGALRYEVRCAVVMCLRCHVHFTGTVNDKIIAVGTRFVVIDGRRCINAGTRTPIPVHFREVA